jgi:hypothetical protein
MVVVVICDVNVKSDKEKECPGEQIEMEQVKGL